MGVLIHMDRSENGIRVPARLKRKLSRRIIAVHRIRKSVEPVFAERTVRGKGLRKVLVRDIMKSNSR